jgi:hypothetical protein
MVRWAATHRMARGPVATLVDYTGACRHTDGVGPQGGGRGKDMVRYMGCMAHWWCSPVLTGLTVRDEAKGGLGPPHRVICQARWALVRVGEGGGAPHTNPLLLPGQVKMAVQDRRNGVMG